MNIKIKVVTILMVLLLCLSFTAGAFETTKVKTQKDIVDDKIKNKDFVKYQQPHDKTKFDREVAGTLDLKVQSTKNKVPDGFEVPDDGYQTMVSYKTNGKIIIRDSEHKIETIQIPWNEIASLPGFNGETVLIKHFNDYGIMDGIWVQHVYNAGGYAYLEELPFSEVIVSGFVGTYVKADSDLNFSDTINLGTTFDSDDVNYINLTVTDKYASKTNPYDINTTGLVGWWRFDEGSGTNVSDSSGNGNHGTFAAANYTTGKYNFGGDFDGVDDSVTINGNTGINQNNSSTISIWYVLNENKQYQGIYDNGFGFNVEGIRIAYIDYNLRCYWQDNFSGSVYLSADYNPGIGELTNVVFVLDDENDNTKMYLNNVLQSDTKAFTYVDRTDIVKDNYIGSLAGVDLYFNGMIDNVMIYNRSLSQDEIEQLYYIKTSQLQTRTNSNTTYSEFWNSSADNPLSIPYGAGESITSLTFNDTAPIIQNSITVYNPVNMLFNTSAEVGYLENTTNIYEEVNDDSYQIYIQHIPGENYTSGTISFTSDANAILSSPYLVTGMESSNTNAVMSYNDATREWTVTTGAISAGETYNYVLFGVLEGTALADLTGTGFGSDNMHAYTATANTTTIIGSEFRATYGDTVWGNQSNDFWEDIGPLLILASLMLVVGVVVVSIRRVRE